MGFIRSFAQQFRELNESDQVFAMLVIAWVSLVALALGMFAFMVIQEVVIPWLNNFFAV